MCQRILELKISDKTGKLNLGYQRILIIKLTQLSKLPYQNIRITLIH